MDYNNLLGTYIVGDIKIHGANAVSPQMIMANLSIAKGDTITLPGDALIAATRSLVDRRFFSDIKVGTTLRADTVDIDLYLQERTRVTEWKFTGIKSSDIKALGEKLKLRQNNELSEYLISTSVGLIHNYYNEKAFRNATVDYIIVPDSTIPNAVSVVFDITRGDKVRIGEIKFEGNDNLPARKLAKSMKETHKVNINILQSFKFKDKEFRDDLELVRNYARSRGYRDARVVADSLYKVPGKPKRIGVYIKIEEGKLYHYRDITMFGNTMYTTDQLRQMLGFKKGDKYDSEAMAARLGLGAADPNGDPSIRGMYVDQGYLAFGIEPIETVVAGDSVDVQIRIVEGSQFRIKNVTFDGNTRTNDHVIRRELYTQPGDLYSQSLLMGTYQRLASMGQFDAASFAAPSVIPNFQQELVDIGYSLKETPNDQVEISGGWGGGMFIASVGINFTNVSVRKLFDKKAWKSSFYPTGDNQTIGIKVQTNGTYYRAASINFVEPWLGGRKPTSLSVSIYTSRETNSYNIAQRATAYFGTIGGTVGITKRLSWPDRSFVFSAGITMQSYNLYNWDYFLIKNGRSNTLALNLSIGRNSVDDPYQYATRGSNISLSAALTPPWSLFDGKDYTKPMEDSERYKWIEYHKWKLNAQWYFPLTPKLVVMVRAQYGYLGSYNANKPSPFEGFQMGGDGLSGYSLYGVETVGLRGYRNNTLTPYADYGTYASIFSKYTAELRYPIVRSGQTMVYALVFAEAGNAFQRLSDFKPFSLKRAAGVGLRVYLPFLGMLGIDWGYGFDAVSSSNNKPSGAQFHFSMGMQM